MAIYPYKPPFDHVICPDVIDHFTWHCHTTISLLGEAMKGAD